ncbi:hypothetical protein GOP47_0014648 [Adiantum capillus-veneris]|uniref:BRCT domain-containing protein n=1 Tax=Adiantum capillus-veneris TaxID=13818 RepID=A0A9D4ULW3_ADICA|nr:hypothetical protein GOP47_0014648 [Adiantum capillus-veneris]
MLGVVTNSGSQDSPPPPLFAGVFFLLSGFDPSTQSQLEEALEQHGGVNVGEYNGSCTHVIVPRTFLWDDPVCAATRKDGKCLCSEIWVSDCLEHGVIADVNHVVYRPLRDSQGIPGTKNLVVCLTGYQGSARRNVMRMVYMMGAQFSKPLVAHRITHLVCYKFEGEKFSLAKQLGLKLVNHQWLEDCLRTWALLSEEDYKKSGFEVELSEVEAKDSEDDGNLKSSLLKSEVPKGPAIPCSGGEREEVKFQAEINKFSVEHSAKDKQKEEHIFSDFSSPQKQGDTVKKSNVTSIMGEQNVVIENEFVSEMQEEGRHANLTSPQIKGTPDVLRSSKKQTIVVNVDDSCSLLEQGVRVCAGGDSPGTILLEGCDLGSSCKGKNVSKLATPNVGNSNSVEFKLAFNSSSINKDEKDKNTLIPQETPCKVSCEVEKMTLDVPVGGSKTTKRKSRLSAKEDNKVSGTKKQGKMSKKSDLTSTTEQKIHTAEEVVSDKKVTSHPEVASSPKSQNVEGSTNNNGYLFMRGGDTHGADESVCILQMEGDNPGGSLSKADKVLKVITPTKPDENAANLEPVLGRPGLNKGGVVTTPTAEVIKCDMAAIGGKNLPNKAVPVITSMSKGKRNQTAKSDVEVSGTKKQGKQSKNLEIVSTTKKRISTAEKMVLDKENVACQSHDCKSEGKVSQEAAVGRKPHEMTGSQDKMSNVAKVTSQRCFALSGRKDDIKPLQALVKKLGGKLCRESHQWSHQTTHLVVAGQLRRTEKLFAAAAAGRWIVRDDYLRDSCEVGSFLDEKKYEWHGVGMTKDGAISFEAPRKWREQRETAGCCALEGLRILLYGECIIPSLDTLRRAIRAGGADLVATCPPYTKFLASKVDFAIVNPGTPKNDQWIQEFLSHDIACVTTDFFVDFVCKPSSSLDRHILYDTHSLVEAVVTRLQASNAGAKRGRQESIDKGEEGAGGEDICCAVCGRSDREDVMLLCGDDKGSGCGTAMHIDCCKPPLEKVPANDCFNEFTIGLLLPESTPSFKVGPPQALSKEKSEGRSSPLKEEQLEEDEGGTIARMAYFNDFFSFLNEI